MATDQCMNDKATAKAWMFDMLAKIEVADEVHGSRTESGNKVVIEIRLK